jgi:hypothetical protein
VELGRTGTFEHSHPADAVEERSSLSDVFFVNDQAPPGVKMRAAPEHAAIGQLRAGTSMEQVATYLVEHDVPEDRIHFLGGEGGISFLEHLGNWFSQLLSETWTDARYALADGKSLVGVFDVDRADATEIRRLLVDAGVEHIRYFGKWTWTE